MGERLTHYLPVLSREMHLVINTLFYIAFEPEDVIEEWRREYNEERPKKSLGGLTPSQYAKQLTKKAVTVPA